MGAQSMLDQLLKSGLSALGGLPSGAAGGRGGFGKYASGAAAGGALALLLGSRSGRRLGGKVIRYGSVAAIGALAWKVQQLQLAPALKTELEARALATG